MVETLFVPEYKFVFTLNAIELFGVNHSQRCLKDSFLSMDPPHFSLRPTSMLFISKRRTIWTVFTVGTGVVVFRRMSSWRYFDFFACSKNTRIDERRLASTQESPGGPEKYLASRRNLQMSKLPSFEMWVARNLCLL